MSLYTPRISAPHLESFSNRTVRIIGKVVQLRGDTAVIDAGGQVECLLSRDCHLQVQNAVEIVGKVHSDLKVKVLNSTDFGAGIDMGAVDAVVDATHRYKEIFYADD
ncbi:MAG: hypothetical protein M1828_005427 [Chrysothrix sp. TS-e1954]|nr:MAG: hypothetical protein M1828_005427 [Chrysothrix sp. TS-e1954]